MLTALPRYFSCLVEIPGIYVGFKFHPTVWFYLNNLSKVSKKPFSKNIIYFAFRLSKEGISHHKSSEIWYFLSDPRKRPKKSTEKLMISIADKKLWTTKKKFPEVLTHNDPRTGSPVYECVKKHTCMHQKILFVRFLQLRERDQSVHLSVWVLERKRKKLQQFWHVKIFFFFENSSASSSSLRK